MVSEETGREAMFALLRALRPKQWVKNSFCLAPLIFSRQALQLDAVREAGWAVLAFTMVASTIYLINDLRDRESDRVHPVKKNRPIASGALGTKTAVAVALLLGLGSLAVSYLQSWQVLAVIGTYLLLNIGYTFGLKRIVLVDIFVIAIGFVLRVMAGAAAIEVEASQWILTCTLFLALLLAACKRRSEVESQGPDAGTRKVLLRYSLKYLDVIIAIVAGGAILSYALYAMSPVTIEHLGTTNLIYTLPFVVFAVFRYIYLVLERTEGESPFELLVRDGTIWFNIVGYLIVTILVVYIL